jgi:hypothetical protein
MSSAIGRSHRATVDPIRAVSVISTGSVEIHPEHALRTRKPLYWWLLSSRRWLPPRPINVYVIEHANGLLLFDTGQDRASLTDAAYFPGGFPGIVYDRLARFHIGEDETLDAQLATLGYTTADVDTAVVSHLHQDHIGGIPVLRNADLLITAAEWAQLGRVLPGGARLPLRAHRHSRREVEAHRLRPDHRRGTCAVHRVTRHRGRRLADPAADTRPHRRLGLAAHPTAHAATAAAYGRPHLRRRAARAAPASRCGRSRPALAEHLPGLVILPAHDPTAAERLLGSTQ